MAPSGSQRSSGSITATACSTPKLIQLFGNIHIEPRLTSTAQPAICSQRRRKRRVGTCA